MPRLDRVLIQLGIIYNLLRVQHLSGRLEIRENVIPQKIRNNFAEREVLNYAIHFILYRQLGSLAFSRRFWPKIKQLLATAQPLTCKINYKTKQPTAKQLLRLFSKS